MDISKSTKVAIIGASGSGKSSLLNIASLMQSPKSGSIFILGKSAFDLNDYDKSYELFSKNETLIDDNLHLSCSRFMSTNTPYYIHQDRDKYYNSKLKYNVNNYSYNEIIDTFKYLSYKTKLLLKN